MHGAYHEHVLNECRHIRCLRAGAQKNRKGSCSYQLQGWPKTTEHTAFYRGMLILLAIFLAQWSVYPSEFSAASLRCLSPVTQRDVSADLLWEADKEKQSYSLLRPVCGGTVGPRPLPPKLGGELWLAERTWWCMKGEFTRESSFLSSATVAFYRQGPSWALGWWHSL